MLPVKTSTTSEEQQGTRLITSKVLEVPTSNDLEKSTIAESVIASSIISKVVLTPSSEQARGGLLGSELGITTMDKTPESYNSKCDQTLHSAEEKGLESGKKDK